MSLGITANCDPAPVASHQITLRHGVLGVVRPLGVHVRSKLPDDGLYRGFAKDYDPVDAGERSDDLRAFVFRDGRSPRTLVSAGRRVRVDRDHEGVAMLGRILQVAKMSHVKKVEYAVGQHERSRTGRAKPIKKDLQGDDFVLRSRCFHFSAHIAPSVARSQVAAPI
jgi:hypothetical protein